MQQDLAHLPALTTPVNPKNGYVSSFFSVLFFIVLDPPKLSESRPDLHSTCSVDFPIRYLPSTAFCATVRYDAL